MTRHRPLCLFVFAAAAATALAACGTSTAAPASAPAPLVIACDEFAAQPHAAADRQLLVGQKLEVVICSNPSTGFAWQAPSSASSSVRLVDSAYHAPSTKSGEVAPLGAAGGETFVFEATSSGTADLHFDYSQPWAGGTRGAWSIDLHLVVP